MLVGWAQRIGLRLCCPSGLNNGIQYICICLVVRLFVQNNELRLPSQQQSNETARDFHPHQALLSHGIQLVSGTLGDGSPLEILVLCL